MRRLGIAPIAMFLLLACGTAVGPSTSPTPTAPPTPTASESSNESAIVATIPTANGPIVLAATDDTVWVENHRSNFVSRIDPIQNLEVERLTEATVHCDIAAGGGFVWATQASTSSVLKLDAATGDVIDTFSLSDACGVATDGEDVWITSPGEGEIVRYDAQTADVLASVQLAPMVFAVAIGPEAVWVAGEADRGTVYRIDPATNTLVASIKVTNPFAVGIAVGHGAVWVAAREQRVIYRIDPATNAVTATIDLPVWVGGVAVGPDAIWASGFGDGKVYRIDPATNQITASVSTGLGNLGPPLVAFGSVWIAALDRNVVVRIDPAAIQ